MLKLRVYLFKDKNNGSRLDGTCLSSYRGLETEAEWSSGPPGESETNPSCLKEHTEMQTI